MCVCLKRIVPRRPVFQILVRNAKTGQLLMPFHLAKVPFGPVLKNVFVPPGIKFEQKVPPKKRVIATKLNLRQKCVNRVEAVLI